MEASILRVVQEVVVGKVVEQHIVASAGSCFFHVLLHFQLVLDQRAEPLKGMFGSKQRCVKNAL